MQPACLGKPVHVAAQRNRSLGSGGKNLFCRARSELQDGQARGFSSPAYRTSPTSFSSARRRFRSQTREYYQEKQNLRALKRQMLLILLFFTVLLLFSVMWVALFLAKQVTVPIQALAEGTREISSGNFEYQVPEQAQDELGILVRSFNTMTTQLRDNRSQIDQFTRNLQQAVQELERRRQLMETVLENIPTGVISLDANGRHSARQYRGDAHVRRRRPATRIRWKNCWAPMRRASCNS